MSVMSVDRYHLRCMSSIKYSDLKSLFQAGLGLLDGVGQIRVCSPRRGRYPFAKSEILPRPVPALSFETQTTQLCR